MKPGQSEKLQALFLDIDGVVLDTEIFQYLATRDVFLRHGVIPSEDVFTKSFYSKNCAGAHWNEYIKRIAPDRTFTPEDLSAILVDRTQILDELLETHDIDLLPDAEDMIQYALERFGYGKFAFTTGATRQESMFKLGKSGIDKRVLGELSSGKIKLIGIEEADGKAKPHPQIYIATQTALSVDPEYAATIEDTAAGCESAKKAGVGIVIAAPNELTVSDKLPDYADHIVSNLGQAKEYIMRL